jgi:hypothetical protein
LSLGVGEWLSLGVGEWLSFVSGWVMAGSPWEEEDGGKGKLGGWTLGVLLYNGETFEWQTANNKNERPSCQ